MDMYYCLNQSVNVNCSCPTCRLPITPSKKRDPDIIQLYGVQLDYSEEVKGSGEELGEESLSQQSTPQQNREGSVTKGKSRERCERKQVKRKLCYCPEEGGQESPSSKIARIEAEMEVNRLQKKLDEQERVLAFSKGKWREYKKLYTNLLYVAQKAATTAKKEAKELKYQNKQLTKALSNADSYIIKLTGQTHSQHKTPLPHSASSK
eukprot:Nk52_evm58s343 gene=Nk52_evmTU58s343